MSANIAEPTELTVADLRDAARRRGWSLTDYDPLNGWIILLPPNWGDLPIEDEPLGPVFGRGTNERHALADALEMIDFFGMVVTFPEPEVCQA